MSEKDKLGLDKLPSLFYIPSSVVHKFLDTPTSIDIVKKAFCDYAIGQSHMPPKMYLDLPQFNGDFRAMPAYIENGYAGMKWVNSHNNSRSALPSVMALFLLNDPKTGQPLAIIEASSLTNIRTGASGGLAAAYLSKPGASRLSLIGAGNQAFFQAKAIICASNLTHISIFDLDVNVATSLKEKLKFLFSGKVTIETSIQHSVESADIIVTTTPSRSPLIKKEWVMPGTHINAIGADAEGKQELDPELLRSSIIVVDDFEQASHSGEINVPISNKIISKSNIRGTLGEILTNNQQGRINSSEITIFDSTGLAVQDLESASHVFLEVKKTIEETGCIPEGVSLLPF
ncbi:ornithine cyclodeaminase family protein [bacterium]|jgi:alanine dehydrogenase|nr:ornithine cyclodeaminase family protein [bacterium]